MLPKEEGREAAADQGVSKRPPPTKGDERPPPTKEGSKKATAEFPPPPRLVETNSCPQSMRGEGGYPFCSSPLAVDEMKLARRRELLDACAAAAPSVTVAMVQWSWHQRRETK